MKKSRLLSAVCGFVILINPGLLLAALIPIDWKVAGDSLIIQDTSTSLDWLMLTETNGLSYSYVSGQLGPGGQFEGFRYASNTEVISLFADYFSIDLTEGGTHPLTSTYDPGIELAATTLGNIVNEWNSAYPYGTAGMVIETHISVFPLQQYMGAMDALDVYGYNIYWDAVEHGTQGSSYIGSYLVRTSAVPLPAAAWLFGSGLLGLIGIAGKKNNG